MKRARAKQGSVVLDKRIKTWNFFWWEDGKRHSKAVGSLRDLPTKAAAWKAAKPLRDAVEERGGACGAPSVNDLAVRYRKEKMPVRIDTRRAYEVWLSNHILPRWGRCLLSDVQARPVELWLASLTLAPKSKAHIRGLLRALWDYAMWHGDVATQRNPMELVKVKGATKRTRPPRSLTVEEFRSLAAKLDEPFRTIALLCVCLGLRISECLALRWSDIDWLNGSLQVERAIVCQNVDDVKTTESRKQLTIDGSLLERLKVWKQATQFSGANDWIFASPVQLGRLPWSYDQIWRVYQKAAKAANLGRLGTHTLRHTFRTWLDSVGTPVGVQQRLMRHADIRTTMNVYGDAVTQDMAEAHGKVVDLALNGRGNGRETS
jgi:integrase